MAIRHEPAVTYGFCFGKTSVIVVFSYQQIRWIISRNNYYCLSGGGGEGHSALRETGG